MVGLYIAFTLCLVLTLIAKDLECIDFLGSNLNFEFDITFSGYKLLTIFVSFVVVHFTLLFVLAEVYQFRLQRSRLIEASQGYMLRNQGGYYIRPDLLSPQVQA